MLWPPGPRGVRSSTPTRLLLYGHPLCTPLNIDFVVHGFAMLSFSPPLIPLNTAIIDIVDSFFKYLFTGDLLGSMLGVELDRFGQQASLCSSDLVISHWEITRYVILAFIAGGTFVRRKTVNNRSAQLFEIVHSPEHLSASRLQSCVHCGQIAVAGLEKRLNVLVRKLKFA